MFFKKRFLRFSRNSKNHLYLFNLFFNFNNFFFEFLGYFGYFKFNLNFFFFKIKNYFLKIFSLNFFKFNDGFIYSCFFNLIKGLIFKYEKKLILFGIGYKVFLKFNILYFFLSYSHPLIYNIPNDVIIKIFSNEIIVTGISKQRVGEVSLFLRNFKKPDSYKGKGIRYFNEKIFLKSIKKK